MQIVDFKKQGRINRAKGARFELKLRKKMEEEGWIVDKWSNNIDLQTDEIVKAKSNRFLSRSCGFPDFVMFKKYVVNYDLQFVECKVNGTLSKEEKLKMNALIDKGFDCYVAYLENRDVMIRKVKKYVDKNKT